jgi:hypothetical protein
MPGDFPALGPHHCCTTLTRKPRRRLTRLAGPLPRRPGGQPMASAASRAPPSRNGPKQIWLRREPPVRIV